MAQKTTFTEKDGNNMVFNVTEKIRYIGVDDTDIDLFESQYTFPNGIAYNSYLITDEKVAIMDTVDLRKSRFSK